MQLQNPFKLITLQEISDYIDMMYETYKLQGDPDEILLELSKNDNKKMAELKSKIKARKNGENGFVLFYPTDDKDVRVFAEIDAKREQMVLLRKKQIELIKRKEEYKNRNFSIYPEKYFALFEKLEKEIEELYFDVNKLPQIAISKQSENENKIWFTVGLIFAKGEINELISKHNRNYTKIANELGNKSFRPYISETASNSTNSDKNIYCNWKKMKAIYDYCQINNIKIHDDFWTQFNLLKSNK